MLVYDGDGDDDGDDGDDDGVADDDKNLRRLVKGLWAAELIRIFRPLCCRHRYPGSSTKTQPKIQAFADTFKLVSH